MKKLLSIILTTVLGIACVSTVLAEENRVDPCLNGHEFMDVQKEYHPATCTEDAYWIIEPVCAYCGITKTEYEGDGSSYEHKLEARQSRLGHQYTVTCNKPATCTENGEYTRTCSRCGYVDTVIKAATGHVDTTGWIDVTLVEPTCSEEGLSCSYRICLTCGEKVDYKEYVLSTRNHDFEWIRKVVTYSTCEQDGLIREALTCTLCGYEEEVNYDVEDKLNHYSTTLLGFAEPTCTEDGYTGDIYCDICHKIISYGADLPALGHDYVETRTEATCTEDGSVTYTCTVCGDTYVAEVIPATGHRYGSGHVTYDKVTKIWTSEETCSICGYVNTQQGVFF